MTDFQRAYSAEHKAERYADLMKVTDRLFREKGFHGVTMSAIAEEIGWTRSNLYRYARSTEEVFLSLYSEKHRAFVDDLVSTVGGTGLLSAVEFAERFASVADRHHDYLDYQNLLTGVIETNVPYDRLLAFKTELLVVLKPAVALVQQQCPGLGHHEAEEFYLALVYQATGLNGHFHCTEAQAEAVNAAGVTFASEGFAPALALIAAAVITGARAR